MGVKEKVSKELNDCIDKLKEIRFQFLREGQYLQADYVGLRIEALIKLRDGS